MFNIDVNIGSSCVSPSVRDFEGESVVPKFQVVKLQTHCAHTLHTHTHTHTHKKKTHTKNMVTPTPSGIHAPFPSVVRSRGEIIKVTETESELVISLYAIK